MVYEGEQEGAAGVAHKLISASIRNLAPEFFPGVEHVQSKKKPEARAKFEQVLQFFEGRQTIDLNHDASAKAYEKELNRVTGLKTTVETLTVAQNDGITLLMELLLHALAEYSLLDRKVLNKGFKFQDYFSSVLGF